MNITAYIKDELLCHGADLVGFGDILKLPKDVRHNMAVGIVIAVKYPKEIIKGIAEMPTKEYYEQYNLLNNKLDMLVNLGADALKSLGYKAIAQSRSFVEQNETDYSTVLPHKTVATRAGLGWIGKCALLITPKYGSAVRISSILTNAPLKTAAPINTSKCGNCMVCKDICPANAVLGKNWSVCTQRERIYNAHACRKTARERALASFGIEITQCGKCIAACPYTKAYIKE